MLSRKRLIYQSFSDQPCLIFLLQSHSGVTLTLRSHSGVTLFAPESLRSYSVCSEVTPELLWLLWSHSRVTLSLLWSHSVVTLATPESLWSYSDCSGAPTNAFFVHFKRDITYLSKGILSIQYYKCYSIESCKIYYILPFSISASSLKTRLEIDCLCCCCC